MFEQRFQVRYMEADAQGVVFNAWYLTYVDESMAAFLGAGGLPYRDLLRLGFDVQLVRCEIDWSAGLRWEDEFAVRVSTASTGRTSFTLAFEFRRGEETTCRAVVTYVVVATDGSGKRPIPPELAPVLAP